MAKLISGIRISQEIKDEIKEEVKEIVRLKGIRPGLGVILVGDNPASKVYVRNKQISCKEVGFKSESIKMDENVSTEDILKEIDKLNYGILDDGEIKRKRGLLIYPSTRPLNRTLEFCSNPYIPEVTGNIEGVVELLRGLV